MKTDILKGVMYFSYEQGSLANLHAVPASRVREILAANHKGVKPASLQEKGGTKVQEFVSAVGDDSITRFDEQKKRRNNQRKNNNRRRNRSGKDGGKGGERKDDGK